MEGHDPKMRIVRPFTHFCLMIFFRPEADWSPP
ncbi:hypothetical protein FHR98_001584 [Limibacillus halophilus]|uniref:Uncharacterized protein n=1 Tax=Limibacillus halophilus TaxID=1579333 RepID=A0A839SWG8_9PROT|nr:hypothetical protein [Limibacillus halophilus]